MIIDALVNDGSPLGVTMKDLWGEGNRGIGIGGSEYALLTVLEGFTNRGHTVRLYNDPKEENASPFQQLPLSAFEPNDNRDVLITFRSPNPRSIVSKGLKVWWSCDQYTIGSFQQFAPHMDKIVCISSFHANHFKEHYRITGANVIDIPIRTQDLEKFVTEPIILGRCIFTSVPDRGLHILRNIWPRIKMQVPEASLVITSDYRLWGMPHPQNEQHRSGWLSMPDVTFLGAVKRHELLLQQARSQLLLYPCIYDELFCVAVAEAECMGVIPVTSSTGALATTNMGKIITIDPKNVGMFGIEMANAVANLVYDKPDYQLKSDQLMVKSIERFNVDNIINQWENLFNE